MRNLRPSKSSVAGHKRSRDDLTAEDDDNDELPAAPTSVPLPIGSQSINGPSMTYNFPSQPGPSNNSTNTQANLFWMQQQQQQQASQSSSSFSDRQRATARKSQRMSRASNQLDQPRLGNSNKNDEMVANIDHSRNSSVNSINNINQPTIDAASHALGISWTQLTGDPALEAAARGWSRYIANNFMLTDVQILLHSKSDRDGGYLVRAVMDGELRYCRFSEDLDWFQIVAVQSGNNMEMVPAQTEEEALACVRQMPLPVLERMYTRSDRVAMTAVATVAPAFPPVDGTAIAAAAAVTEGTGLASAGFLGDRAPLAMASSQAQLQAFGANGSSVDDCDKGAMMEIGSGNEDNDMMMEMTL